MRGLVEVALALLPLVEQLRQALHQIGKNNKRTDKFMGGLAVWVPVLQHHAKGNLIQVQPPATKQKNVNTYEKKSEKERTYLHVAVSDAVVTGPPPTGVAASVAAGVMLAAPSTAAMMALACSSDIVGFCARRLASFAVMGDAGMSPAGLLLVREDAEDAAPEVGMADSSPCCSSWSS